MIHDSASVSAQVHAHGSIKAAAGGCVGKPDERALASVGVLAREGAAKVALALVRQALADAQEHAAVRTDGCVRRSGSVAPAGALSQLAQRKTAMRFDVSDLRCTHVEGPRVCVSSSASLTSCFTTLQSTSTDVRRVAHGNTGHSKMKARDMATTGGDRETTTKP